MRFYETLVAFLYFTYLKNKHFYIKKIWSFKTLFVILQKIERLYKQVSQKQKPNST